MSNRYKGGIISATAATTSTSTAKGIWTVAQQMQSVGASVWPRSPGAPTIGTATATGTTTATVAYTASTDAGAGSVTYTATSSPGGLTGTGASPITVSGLTGGTSYTFTVQAATPGGASPSSAASNSITTPNSGSQAYTSSGTYSWVAPTGVTSVSILTIGGGSGGTGGQQGGGGGGLRYRNNYSVNPGCSYTVVVGVGGPARTNGGNSYFINTCTIYAGGGSSCTGTRAGGTGSSIGGSIGGGNGGAGGSGCHSGGGGGGGYAGNGGKGANQGPTNCFRTGCNGAGGGGGGGAGGGNSCYCSSYWYISGGGGGGTGIYGQGANGVGDNGYGYAGGGSGGGNAGAVVTSYAGPTRGSNGGNYGGGGGGAGGVCNSAYMGTGGSGAVRIIWPGNTRSFPSTCAGSP